MNMRDFVQKMLNEFPIQFKEGDSVPTAAIGSLLEKGSGKALAPDMREAFHKTVAQGFFFVREQGRIFSRPLQCYVQGY